MPYRKAIFFPAVAALALSLSACNPEPDTTSSKASPGDPMRSAQGPGATDSPSGSTGTPSDMSSSGSNPGDAMSKEEKERRDREKSTAPSGVNQ